MPLENFKYDTIVLKDDYEGSVEATLISSDGNSVGNIPILYIHGFIDYFFHPHLAKRCNEKGFNFYALELRKYGHSIREHQRPNYCKDLHEYFEELDIAINSICAKENQNLILMGHSTGGLISSLYADHGNKKNKIAKLILNSPFLEFNVPSLLRKGLVPILKVGSAINPYVNLPNAIAPFYPKSIHKDFNGEWDFDLAYKPIKGFPAYFQWMLAIREGHKQIKKGLNINIPILLLHSSASFLPTKWTDEIHKSDIVLNIEHMKKYGPGLGSDVALVEIQDARHDVFLSTKDSREAAFNELFKFLKSE